MPTTLPDFASTSRLLTIRQTMEFLGVRSRSTLWRWVKRYKLKPYKMGDTPQSPTKFSFDELVYWRSQFRKG